MIQNIEIRHLSYSRDLEEGDDISDLTKDMAEHGLQVPILVSPQLEVLDGVRRIKAAQALGDSNINAQVVTTFEELCEGIKNSRLSEFPWRKPSPRRLWQYSKVAQPYIDRRTHQARIERHGKPRYSKVENRLTPARTLLTRALGFNSESYYAAATSVYNIAQNPEDQRYQLANELVAEVDAGNISIYIARDRMEREVHFQGNQRSWGEQRAILSNLVASLSGLVKSTQNLGAISSRIPRAELEGHLADLKNLRNALYKFVRTFEQEIKK